MTDWFHKAVKWISYNRYTAVALVLGVVLVSGVSCQSKAPSPITGRPATIRELNAQFDVWMEEAKARTDKAYAAYLAEVKAIEAEGAALDPQFAAAFLEIEEKDRIKVAVLEMAGRVLPAAPGLSEGLALAAMLLTGGVVADNRRKDKKLKDFKTAAPVAA